MDLMKIGVDIIQLKSESYNYEKLFDYSKLISLLKDINERETQLTSLVLYLNERINEKDKRIEKLETKLQIPPPEEKEISYEEFLKKNNKIFNHKKKETKTKLDELSNITNLNEPIEEGHQRSNSESEENSINQDSKEKTKEEDKSKVFSKNENSINKLYNDNSYGESTKKSQERRESITGPSEVINRLSKKVKDLEKKFKEMDENIKSENSNIMNEINVNKKESKEKMEGIDSHLKFVDSLQLESNEMKEKQDEMKKDLDNLKKKIQDLNIYDIFKGGEEQDMDANKALILGLEQKIFKKFGMSDEKNRKNEENLIKSMEEIKNLLNGVDFLKNENKRNVEKLDKMEKLVDALVNKLDESLNQMKNNITDNTNLLNKMDAEKLSKNELIDKVRSIEDMYNNLKDMSVRRTKSDNSLPNEHVVVRQTSRDNLNELQDRIDLLEGSLKNDSSKLDFIDLKNKLETIDNLLSKKANRIDLIELQERIAGYEEMIKDLGVKTDYTQQFVEKTKSDSSQILKKIEYLTAEYAKLASSKFEKGSDLKSQLVDVSKYLDINLFNENKKMNHDKFESIKLKFEEVLKSLEEIQNKLSHTPNDKDFIAYQGVVKNLLDEMKINNNKKYAERYDTLKSIKYLEAQIKMINETYSRKEDGADNWLIAKKPINNFICASCESVIRGDLDKRSDYVPWNKYPTREDNKQYRIGHGFSRMLQMVNEDIQKYTLDSKEKEKGYNSDEDIKVINKSKVIESEKNMKLPQLKKKNQSSAIDENYIQPLVDHSCETNPYESYDTSNINNKKKEPQIIKIFKRNKKFTENEKIKEKTTDGKSHKYVKSDRDILENHALNINGKYNNTKTVLSSEGNNQNINEN